MYGASFVNAMVTDIIIRRLFVYFLTNEQLFAPKYISQRLKRGQKECEKVSSKTTEKRRTGTRRFGALRLSAAQLSDAHSLIPPPPPLTTSLLRHTHSPRSSSTSPPSPTTFSSWSSPSKCPSKVPWPASPLFSQLYLP